MKKIISAFAPCCKHSKIIKEVIALLVHLDPDVSKHGKYLLLVVRPRLLYDVRKIYSLRLCFENCLQK
jgi:hypothetical protein